MIVFAVLYCQHHDIAITVHSIKKTMPIDHDMHLLNEKNTHLVATDAIPVYRYVIQLK